MRIPLFVARFFILLLATMPLVAHAGDSVGIGSATKIFDTVEYETPFLPAQTGESWLAISKQLKVLETKLPYTADYLSSFFEDGKTVWWFVTATLKDPPDGFPPTNVIITGPREQAAANCGGIIQVRQDIWDTLTPDDRATLLIHEMLWSAVGPDNIRNGSDIALMSRYLLNPNLASFSPLNIHAFLKQMAGGGKDFQSWLAYDADQQSTVQSFRIKHVASGLKNELITTVIAPGATSELQLTTLRPNPLYLDLTRLRSNRFVAYSSGLPRELEVSQLCSTLNYGGMSDWRLPTDSELKSLFKLNFTSAKYPGVGPVFVKPFVKWQRYVNDNDIYYFAVFPNNESRLSCLNNLDGCAEVGLNHDLEDIPYLCVRR